MPPKQKLGKKWRQNQAQAAKRERNWTDMETEAFCEILADGEYSFATTLETMALKVRSLGFPRRPHLLLDVVTQ